MAPGASSSPATMLQSRSHEVDRRRSGRVLGRRRRAALGCTRGELHECPVTAVLCWGYLDQHHGTPDGPFDPAYSRVDARAAVDTIVDGVLGEGAALIDRRTVNDLPARGLVESSADADLLVVGARGLGTLRDLLLGSVSQACLHRARIPVAIVRSTGARPSLGLERVVVGVDGSDTAQRALNWALDEARRRQAAVEVVHAWTPPLLAVPTLAYDYGPFDEAARSIVDASAGQGGHEQSPGSGETHDQNRKRRSRPRRTGEGCRPRRRRITRARRLQGAVARIRQPPDHPPLVVPRRRHPPQRGRLRT